MVFDVCHARMALLYKVKGTVSVMDIPNLLFLQLFSYLKACTPWTCSGKPKKRACFFGVLLFICLDKCFLFSFVNLNLSVLCAPPIDHNLG